jgi:hypothetical protein
MLEQERLQNHQHAAGKNQSIQFSPSMVDACLGSAQFKNLFSDQNLLTTADALSLKNGIIAALLKYPLISIASNWLIQSWFNELNQNQHLTPITDKAINLLPHYIQNQLLASYDYFELDLITSNELQKRTNDLWTLLENWGAPMVQAITVRNIYRDILNGKIALSHTDRNGLMESLRTRYQAALEKMSAGESCNFRLGGHLRN